MAGVMVELPRDMQTRTTSDIVERFRETTQFRMASNETLNIISVENGPTFP